MGGNQDKTDTRFSRIYSLGNPGYHNRST